MKIGDIVIDRYSKASLKRKIYRVVYVGCYPEKTTLMSPKGRSLVTTDHHWRFINLDRYAEHLLVAERSAVKNVVRAENLVCKKRQAQIDFERDKSEINKWFPKV